MKPLSEAKIRKIKKLRGEGLSKTEVAERVPCSMGSVTRHDPWKTNGALPTKSASQNARKAKALVPTAMACPHCDGPIAMEAR